MILSVVAIGVNEQYIGVIEGTCRQRGRGRKVGEDEDKQ